MKSTLFAILLLLSTSSFGQELARFAEIIPDVGQDSTEKVCFYLFSVSDAREKNIPWDEANSYNETVQEMADLYFNGDKLFLEKDEIDKLEFEDNVKFLFEPVLHLRVGGKLKFCVVRSLETDLSYFGCKKIKGSTTLKSECKKTMELLEQSRLQNAVE